MSTPAERKAQRQFAVHGREAREQLRALGNQSDWPRTSLDWQTVERHARALVAACEARREAILNGGAS